MIFDLELFEETAEKLYNIIPQSESIVHHVYTPDRAFSKGFKYLNKKKKNVVFFNWENCVRMVWLYKFDVKKITFISDADWKSVVLKEYLPDIKIIKYNEATIMKYQKQFDGGAINPAFAISLELRAIAEKLVTNKLLMVLPSRDFENEKALNNIVYYKSLGSKAFTEQVMTTLCVSDVTGNTINNIIVENLKGEQITVTDLPFAPSEDLDDWLYAIKVINLGLPGLVARNGKGQLDYSKGKDVAGGTLCIFTVGSKGDVNFGQTKNIGQDQLEYAIGFGEHKLVWSKTGSIGKLPAFKYAGPDTVHGFGTLSCKFDSKEEVLEVIKYLESKEVYKLVKGIKTNTVVNGVGLMKKIPQLAYKDKWISQI